MTRPHLADVLKTKPLPYQFAGIKAMYRAKGRIIQGDDMGLGKTLQALGLLGIMPQARPAVIVTPANAKWSWRGQIKEHTKNMKAQVLEGKKPKRIYRDIVILNYEILTAWLPALKKINPKFLIMDEAHYTKNPRAKRTKACMELARLCDHVIPMTGTPLVNKPIDLWPMLHMLDQKTWPSQWKFAMRYCAPKRTHWGWDFSGSSNTEELKQHLTKNMIRRLKDDVLPELPDWRESLIHVDIERRREYRRAEADFIQWYEENVGKAKSQNAKKAEALVRTGQLKKLAAECKLKAMRQWIDDFLEETDGKLIVFCYHRNIFSELQKTYNKIACIGGKSGPERQKQVDTFQTNPKRRIFIGSIKADAEAITLTAASSVLFAEVGWTPKEHDQCRDRARRIGQKSFVNVYYLLGHGTIDTHCYNVVQEKRRIVEEIVDGAMTEKTYGDDVSRLVTKMKGQKKHDQ